MTVLYGDFDTFSSYFIINVVKTILDTLDRFLQLLLVSHKINIIITRYLEIVRLVD